MKIVEAAILMPMTVLITAALITANVDCFHAMSDRADEHIASLTEIYAEREVKLIRICDGVKGVIE